MVFDESGFWSIFVDEKWQFHPNFDETVPNPSNTYSGSGGAASIENSANRGACLQETRQFCSYYGHGGDKKGADKFDRVKIYRDEEWSALSDPHWTEANVTTDSVVGSA